jgi:hypothetical protein
MIAYIPIIVYCYVLKITIIVVFFCEPINCSLLNCFTLVFVKKFIKKFIDREIAQTHVCRKNSIIMGQGRAADPPHGLFAFWPLLSLWPLLLANLEVK